MKKLMIAASAAFIATVGLSLESANVVGYSEVGLRLGSKGAGACFVNIDQTKPMNLQDLKVTGYNKEDGYEAAGVTVQTLDFAGREIETYTWYDIPGDFSGWFDSKENYVEDLTIAPGEGLYARAPDTSFKIQSAGQVATTDIAVNLRLGSKLVVNPTPVTINLNDINEDGNFLMVTGYDAEVGYEAAGVTIQTLDYAGREIETYTWYDIPGDFFGWFDSKETYVENLTIAPGESVYARAPDTTFSLVFPAPTL
jgi:hypothetical protein